ncbi:hypothetical protein [Janibacter sp. GXQ6167]|uniref:hypothetical protein n=1 Tax=Janibacter sp. GXQ6167 TaxID=3240791 RepID=UPI0035249D7F
MARQSSDHPGTEVAASTKGPKSAVAASLVENLLQVGIDGKGPFDSASEVADAALAKHKGNADKAIKEVQRSHLKLVAGNGFITGLGGFIVLPVAMPANILGFYVVATRMAAAVAKLRGYDITDPAVRSAVLLSLVGADAAEILGKAGLVAPSGKVTSMALKQLPGPALMVVNKAIGFRLVTKAGSSALTRFGKYIPVVGGGIGASVDSWMYNQIATNVKQEFPRTDRIVTQS